MKSRTLVYAYILVVVAYLATVLFFPLDPTALERYNISSIQLRLIGLSMAIPLILVWFMSLYGFLKFRSYANLITKEKEGPAYDKLATGLMVLSFSLPANSLIAAVLNYFALEYPGFADVALILRNYSSLLSQLAAFYILSQGAALLVATLKPKVKIIHSRGVVASIIAFSSLFTWLSMASPFGGSPVDTYQMPELVVILTLVIPYLITWYVGLLSAYRLSVYYHKINGEIYKKCLSKLVAGIGVIIGLSIAIQLLVSVSEKLSRLNFTPLLLLVYLLVGIYVVGFGLVAFGARQLKKIEEV